MAGPRYSVSLDAQEFINHKGVWAMSKEALSIRNLFICAVLSALIGIPLSYGAPGKADPRPVPKPKVQAEAELPDPTATVADPDEPAIKLPASYLPAEVIELHDADTPRLRVRMGWDVAYGPKMFRITGYDAWEVDRSRIQVQPFKSFTDAQWKEEISKGKKARDEFQALINQGTLYVCPTTEKDPYGRPHGKLYVLILKPTTSWIDVAVWMREKGHQRQ